MTINKTMASIEIRVEAGDLFVVASLDGKIVRKEGPFTDVTNAALRLPDFAMSLRDAAWDDHA